MFLNLSLFFRSKSEGLEIQTIESIDIDQATDNPKPVRKRGRRPKVKEESIDIPISRTELIQNNVLTKNDKQKRSSVENLIEMLESDDKDDEGITNDIEDDCSEKMIQPADIKREAMHPDLETIDDEEELDESAMIDDDDSDYEGNDDSKNDNESSSPKKTKVNRNSMKKKTPEILIPQMVSYKIFFFIF